MGEETFEIRQERSEIYDGCNLWTKFVLNDREEVERIIIRLRGEGKRKCIEVNSVKACKELRDIFHSFDS